MSEIFDFVFNIKIILEIFNDFFVFIIDLEIVDINRDIKVFFFIIE